MNDITATLGTRYHPKAALVVYEAEREEKNIYVEYFDIHEDGQPVNAHPLTVKEAEALAEALKVSEKQTTSFLKPETILPNNVLYIDSSSKGFALWWTKAGMRNVFFAKNLGIPNGTASVPPLLWLANKTSLHIYALISNRKPHENTPLYYAPFFNVYENGNVCMGTVNVDIEKAASLEAFMAAWEQYFFESYFSHLIGDYQPVKTNCVNLWKELVQTEKTFPKDALVKTNRTIKNLLP